MHADPVGACRTAGEHSALYVRAAGAAADDDARGRRVCTYVRRAAPRDPIPMLQIDQVKRNIQGPGRSGLIDSKHDSRNIRVCFSFIILIYLQGK
jgi:hypothetical protein